ncbi:hypothetical protein [Anaerobranca gottschalkii]|uniref:Uncharacterized protein n=1 Tax=Anaerobranca gottschalkii DSM 13577 TaxID=1120990 RepID=A0A1H9ZQB5_9FIRM|nr:hypothetical protein [Anaerobranca gottschalkii]SES83404.1 hypothetical protein SAMN03080614_101142 [Anaerobranca gottschalkii DSM 13577]
MFKKIISSALICILGISFLGGRVAKAEEVLSSQDTIQSILNAKVEEKYDPMNGCFYYGMDFDSLTEEEMQILSNGNITVKINEIIVAIIIGGTIIYSTGKSAEEWVAISMEWSADALRWVGSGAVELVRWWFTWDYFVGYNGNGCVSYDRGMTWICPY